jgi:sn-glycerol 3-phosphate transport system permease protein
MRRRRGWRTAGRYLLLTLVAAIVLLPIYVTVVGSLQPGVEFLDFPRSLFPTDPTLSVLGDAWEQGNLGQYLLNSALVSVLITVGQVTTSILAAYAFAFLDLPGKTLLFALFMATLMIPTEVSLLVNVETVQDLGWVNSYQALVVPFLAAAFGTFLLRQTFLALPRDLRDAAAVDGLGHARFLWQVAVPLARPALGALAVFSFLSAWNQYLWPLLVADEDRYRTVQIGLRALSRTELSRLNLVMAGTVIAALPIFVLLLLFQRQLIRGLTAGAVKG